MHLSLYLYVKFFFCLYKVQKDRRRADGRSAGARTCDCKRDGCGFDSHSGV